MLILDNPKTWPKHIIDQLNQPSVIKLLTNNNFIDCVLKDSDIKNIFADVEYYAKDKGIAGYHCAKQLPEKPYKKIGLRILDFEKHHSEFLDYLKENKLVNEKQFQIIKTDLAKFKEKNRRENQLWFCFTRQLVFHDDGCEKFFKYYGGEAIYMAFVYEENRTKIKTILEQIGEPVVVEAHIPIENLTLTKENPFGNALVSYFASTINPKFYNDGLEGYVKKNIMPSKITNVYPYETLKITLKNNKK